DNQLDAAVTLVNELNVAIDTGLVALLLKSGSSERFKIAAMSGVEFFDRNAATTQTIESSILGLQDQPTFWSSIKSTDTQHDTESHINLQNFCQSMELPGCAALPLHDHEKNIFGWLLIGLKTEQCNEEKTEIQFLRISKLVAGHLETVLRAQRPISRTLLDNTLTTLKKNSVRKFAMLIAFGIIILCIPFTYKIPCDCQLELTRRRFVAAPYEGLLEKTIVENGDIVTQGQPLARMDASHLRMEMSSLQADLERERKKRDSALARRNVAESQIASSEMKRLSAEIAIISKRLSHTEIRSPIDGVIISGDLDKAEGAPLETGQNLFEVGPLEKMLVEILIPENEIQHVAAGMPVHFEFNAFPFETFTGEIEKIHPRAEVLDQQCVFVAHVQLDNESGQLRPGLKGRAKIMGATHSLGWNLFHGVWENARKVLIW
ncbi:MAG: efflux RND transporter periplasmic adaptor subunit, partial [Pirellulaceae bacterium]|nr:efflux RND transporter periplasmic adaptor subunit [Pirellulaceae bacterium]